MNAQRTDYYHVDGAPRPNRIVPAASAVVEHAGGIVLQRRRDNGMWSLPGGAMNIGESIRDTCVREVAEETGLSVEITRLLGVYSDPEHVIAYSDGEVRQQFSVCFVCRSHGGNLRASDESYRVAIFDPYDLPDDLHPAQSARIHDYLRGDERPNVD